MFAVMFSLGISLVAAMNPSPTEQAGEWRSLFDGKTLSGWRGYSQPQALNGWKVEDGALVRFSKGGDIVTADEFGDFELSLEWKVAPGGNSGIFYRAQDGAKEIWHQAPEYQILDNKGHKDGQDPLTSTASCYALYAPSKDASKPAGEWNETRIIARGSRVEHWLNGAKVVEFDTTSEDWKKRVAASKFKVYPGFGEQQKGRIGLQDHGDVVSYRNIRIRELR
jgi:hypothetical protein